MQLAFLSGMERMAMSSAKDGPHQHLRTWRKKLGLTQDQLGDAIGAKTSTISMIENGRQGVTLEQLAAIAAVYGIGAEKLLNAPPCAEIERKEAARNEIMAIFDQLPEPLKAVYLAQAKALLGAVPDPEQK